jgi:hypothetical protein
MRKLIEQLEAQQKNIWHDAGISLQIAMERGDDSRLNERELDRLVARISSTTFSRSASVCAR